MTARAETASTDELLARWAELLLYRNGLANSAAFEFEARFNPVWERDEEKRFARSLVLVPADDFDDCHEITELLLAQITTKIASAEAELLHRGIEVRRADQYSEPSSQQLTTRIAQLEAELAARQDELSQAISRASAAEALLQRPSPAWLASTAYGWKAADLLNAILDAEPKNLDPGEDALITRLLRRTDQTAFALEDFVLLAQIARRHTSVEVGEASLRYRSEDEGVSISDTDGLHSSSGGKR